MRILRSGVFGLVVSLAPAQTFVVDLNNGLGTNFTSIAAAAAAVPSGATLLVRPGWYTRFEVVAKSLTVLCDAGVELISSSPASPYGLVSVRNLTVGQTVVIQGLRFAQLGHEGGSIRDCAGAVVIEDFVDGRGYNLQNRPSCWFVWNSDQVLFRNAIALQSVFWDSDVVLEQSRFTGDSANCGFGSCVQSVPALAVSGGTLQVSDSELVGGAGGWTQYGIQVSRSAIQATGADLRVLAPSTLRVGVGLGAAPVPVVDGTGTLRLDPGVQLVNAANPAIAPTIATQSAAMPTLRAVSAAPGGTLRGEALGPVGALVILAVGLPGSVFHAPGIADPLWLDPGAYAFHAVGVPQSGMPLVGTIAVPSNPGFRGLRIGWQAVAVLGGGLEASNPSAALVR